MYLVQLLTATRPEAIESVFILYRITGDQYWVDSGWDMFKSIQAQTETKIAHSAIDNVLGGAPNQVDEMESFWLAETLKYFYLLFSETNVVNLDEYVL
jgi:mannosyl-oligosaccharide alpha-1,2-mannosidase